MLLLTACTLLVGCAGDRQDPLTGPLTALPTCEPVTAGDLQPAAGAHLPPDAEVISVSDQGPLVSLTATVELTPVNVRRFYEDRGDLDVLIIEDEVFEAEVLVSDGTHRTYLRATARCRTGATLLVLVAEESDADLLPVPATHRHEGS